MIRRSAVDRLNSGHPWVYRDELSAPGEIGAPVRLTNNKGKSVAFGLLDKGDIAVRVLGKRAEHISELLNQRITIAIEARAHLLGTKTNCYRAVNASGDGLPGIVLDRYAGVWVLKIYAHCWLPYLQTIVDILSKQAGVLSIFRKFGVRLVDKMNGGELLWGADFGDEVLCTENGIRFISRPYSGQKTGLFLDQRAHRKFISELSTNKVVANLFSYNGGFSVYAAMNGASRVYTVDIAPGAIEDAKALFTLNGINPSNHVFEVADAFRWTSPEQLDLLICDPPALSRGKRSDQQASKAYRELAAHCGRQLHPGKLLATASCTSRLSQRAWEKCVTQGLQNSGQWSWLWRAAEPTDHPIAIGHPEGRYLKFAVLRKR